MYSDMKNSLQDELLPFIIGQVDLTFKEEIAEKITYTERLDRLNHSWNVRHSKTHEVILLILANN